LIRERILTTGRYSSASPFPRKTKAIVRRRHNHPEDVETERASWHEKKAKRERVRAKRRRRKAWVEAELTGPSTLNESMTCGSISSP
jgi:hypothetical protein